MLKGVNHDFRNFGCLGGDFGIREVVSHYVENRAIESRLVSPIVVAPKGILAEDLVRGRDGLVATLARFGDFRFSVFPILIEDVAGLVQEFLKIACVLFDSEVEA
jgi:hypothetical protein